MRKVLKWIGIGLGGLVGLALLAGVVLFAIGSARLNRTYDIQVASVAVPSDEEAIARGEHLVQALTLCQGCHGDDLGGQVFIEEPGMATVYAPNLTPGEGGVGATYTDADYVAAIRHGTNSQGRGLMIMHSDVYHNLSEADLGAIIAYVKSVPPVDNETPERRIMPMGGILVALGAFDSDAIPFIPAEVIDHNAGFEQRPEEGGTAAYGRYLMSITLCSMCHGPDLKGGEPLEPGMPAGTNITTYAGSDGWSQEQFVSTMRTGVTPYGKELDPEFMPWDLYSDLTDSELGAMWLYVDSLASD